MSTPMIDEAGNVAHYTRLRNVANILHDKRLKLGAVCDLADPREASMDWIDPVGYSHEKDHAGWHTARSIKTSLGRQIRLLCTARPTENLPTRSIEEAIYGRPRMWAQYGDNSEGFCLVLNEQSLNDELTKIANRPEYLISGEVNYPEWLDIVTGTSTIEYGAGLDLQSFDPFALVRDMLPSIYFKKAMDWDREREWRWLLYAQGEDELFVSIEKAVEAVVLGWRFPTNQRSQVLSYCRDLGCDCFDLQYQHPQYYLRPIPD